MEIKAPTPQIPPPVWTEFKDLQEWEKYRQERPEGDKHSALFESITEGIHHFPGGFAVTTVVDASSTGRASHPCGRSPSGLPAAPSR